METSFNDYINRVLQMQEAHPEWRVGQTFFNVLYIMRPKMADQVRGSEIDPFYQDDRVLIFLAFVDEHWGMPNG
jgi:hypothetical protein